MKLLSKNVVKTESEFENVVKPNLERSIDIQPK